MDSNRIKEVIDLFDYVDKLGEERPKMAVILKALGINSQTAQDAVIATAHATHACMPEYAIHVTDELFRLGVTIGYKYAVTKQMEESFGSEEEEKDN